jgi:hypothetical protein
MTFYHSRASPGDAPLARHLEKLSSALDHIGEQLREAIADAVGRTVAEGVGEAILAALSGPDVEPRSHRSSSSSWPWHSPSGWGEPERPSWAREEHGHDERFTPSRYEESDAYEDDDSPEYDTPSEPATERRHMAWATAVTAGLQTAAWSLRREPEQRSVAGSVSVGLLAFLVTLLGGPTAGAVAGLAASALGLLSLPELCDSGIALLRRSVTP